MSFNVGIVFSTEAYALFNRVGLKNVDVLHDLKTYTFDTEHEATAFRDGVEASVGCAECIVKEARPRSKISHIAFGSDDCVSKSYTRIEHSSAAERIAYEEGVEDGEGWFAHVDLEDDQMENYKQANAAMLAAGLPDNPENLVKFIKSLSELAAQA